MKLDVKRIRELIEERGTSVTQVAITASMAPQQLQEILKRETATLPTIDKIAAALGVKGKTLITEGEAV